MIRIKTDASFGCADVTGIVRGKERTFTSLLKTTEPWIFEAEPSLFRILAKRAGAPLFASTITVTGAPGEKPVTIRAMRPRIQGWRLPKLFR